MANRTDKEAQSIHGTNPQNLVEYIIRQKIYQTTYWKESCFALTAESLIERAVELKAVGGTYGGARKPTDFLCLITKMLQIQPAKEIVIEYIKNEDFKYVRLLGAFYMRLVGRPLEVYQYLEPLYNDYRKIRLMTLEGQYLLTHIDEVIDDMLNKDHLFDIALPRLPARYVLEKSGALEPRISVLDEEFDEAAVQQEAEAAAARERQAAQELAGLELADTREREARERDTRERDTRDKDEHDNGRAEERRRDSPERKKERWQLTKEERREQAQRRRSPSRSPSRSPGRGGRDDVSDRRDRDRDRGDRRDRDRDRGDRRDREERRHDDRGTHRDEPDRDRGRDGDRRYSRRSRSRSRDRRDRDRDRRRSRSRSRSPDRRHDRDRGRDRGRSRERERSRDRDRGRGDRDRGDRGDRDRGDKGDRDRGDKAKGSRDKEAPGKSGKPKVPDPEDPEIIEANAQRAALGLPPLK